MIIYNKQHSATIFSKKNTPKLDKITKIGDVYENTKFIVSHFQGIQFVGAFLVKTNGQNKIELIK